ncbi:hypothetical protein N7509_001150 [Penicillium cosmopolitanum]|uniref:CBM-cenC domain-containing protein n=1 Tax=Penicillium cosmopolitanum TaxID=1131564 RepID=A0A9W9WC56_9EURO|nr:uncharacterized protein N7509_001150 [Penicillium cosmopolitanum]KAJ5414523.1 hypothetical protein N7509_001150 [Penicillium cosmopolitanum]
MQFKQLIWQAALPLLLASSATAEKDVTCTTNEVNLIQNPSFESGSLSGWKLVEDNMHLATGHKAAHGDCHLERSSKSNEPLSGVYQEVSGLVKGSTYTVSAQWRIQKPVANGKAACDLAFYMVGGRSTSYLGGYENLRATPENTAWKTVSAEFTAKSTSETLYVYLFCPVVKRHQAKADLDNIKLLSGEKTTTCVTAVTSPTSAPAVSVPALPSIDSSSSNPVIPSQIASVQPSSAPITDSGSITSSHPASSISHSSIPTSSSLTRVTISSRPPPSSLPPPSSRPTLRPITSSSVPVVSSSVTIPHETAPTTGTPTGPSNIPTSLPSSVPTTGSGNEGSGNGGSGNEGSGNGGSGNEGSGNGGSGNGGSGSEGSGNEGSGNEGSGNGGSGNGGSGNEGSGNGSGNNGGSGSVGVTTSAPTAPQLTTSTVFTTRTSTITACAATVTNCPARSTYVTTETILVSTTICPVEASTTTNPGGAIITGSPAAPGNSGGHHYTTETILSTRTITVTACPSTVTNCPARDKTTSIATETVVAGTTVYEVTPTATGVSAGQNPAPGQDSNGNAPGPKVTDIATANPNIPPVYVTSTRVVTVLACPVKKDTLA